MQGNGRGVGQRLIDKADGEIVECEFTHFDLPRGFLGLGAGRRRRWRRGASRQLREVDGAILAARNAQIAALRADSRQIELALAQVERKAVDAESRQGKNRFLTLFELELFQGDFALQQHGLLIATLAEYQIQVSGKLAGWQMHAISPRHISQIIGQIQVIELERERGFTAVFKRFGFTGERKRTAVELA